MRSSTTLRCPYLSQDLDCGYVCTDQAAHMRAVHPPATLQLTFVLRSSSSAAITLLYPLHEATIKGVEADIRPVRFYTRKSDEMN